MVALEEYKTDEFTEKFLRQKMKLWGVVEDKSETASPLDVSLLTNYMTTLNLRRLRKALRDPIEELENLKRRVGELEIRIGKRRIPTKADHVYNLYKEKLEEKHFGKIVAIDTDSEEIVGMGDSVLEAYNDANRETGKEQFDFKRVGYKYVHEV